jgi:Conjugal transfer protein TraD
MNQQRKARTRTLLQLGGLIVKAGITEKLGIKIGTDLQKDELQKKKACTLLGLFITQLSVPTEIEKIKEAENLGKQFLSQKQNDVSEEN